MSQPLAPPKRKDPTKRTRLPLLPSGARSRTAHSLTLAAAEGRFALPGCHDCGAVHYPARDACPKCLSPRLGLKDVSPAGQVSFDPDFLSVEDVILLHDTQLARYGGAAGIRDRDLLESAVGMAQASFGGEYLHADLFAMAAAYAFHIAGS